MFCGKWLVRALALITLADGGSLMAETNDRAWSQQTTYISNSQFISKFTTQNFVPDGNLDKEAWRGASWVKVDHDAFNPVTFPQSATEIASLWTPA